MSTLILLRGKPASGKTTILNHLLTEYKVRLVVLDPDQVDVKSKTYSNYQPRHNKNPTQNVKMYCYLFGMCEQYLRKNEDVLWMQPWSRLAEIEVTLRNLAFYFSNIGAEVWNENINNLINLLPFPIGVIEIEISDEIAETRFLLRNADFNIADKERLKKTNSLFQRINFKIPTLYLNGTDIIDINTEKIVLFIKRLKTNKKQTQT